MRNVSMYLKNLWAGLVMVLFITPSNAQTRTWQWVNQLGSKGWDVSAGICINTASQLYIAGSFSQTLQCGGKKITTLGGSDLFIARYDVNGTMLNVWTAGGKGDDQATCLAPMTDNGVVVGGFITDTVTLGQLTNQAEGQRLFVTRMSALGKFNWISTLTYSEKAQMQHLGADSAGYITLYGSYSGSLSSGKFKVTSNGGMDLFLARYTPEGTLQKLVSYGSTGEETAGAFAQDKAGHIACSMDFGNAFEMDSLKLKGSKQKQNTALVLLDSGLHAMWKSEYASEDFIGLSSMRFDKYGNLYAAGSYSAKLSSADTIFTSLGYTDAFLLKYSAKGDYLWGHSFGTWFYDYANNVVPDNMGGAIVTGVLGDTLVIDSLQLQPAASNAPLLIQFSALGKVLWGDCISGEGQNFGSESVLDKNGNLYVSGAFTGTLQKESSNVPSYGSQDVFLAQYYTCPVSSATILGDTILCPGASNQLYVKKGFLPTWNDSISGNLYLNVSSTGKYWINVYDAKGCLLTDTVQVVPSGSKGFKLGKDTTLLCTDSLLLQAPEGYSGFLWQDGSIFSELWARSLSGLPRIQQYKLKATDPLGCSSTDSLVLTFVEETASAVAHSKKSTTTTDTPLPASNGKQGLNIYPNPVNTTLIWSISSKNIPSPLRIEITDGKGMMVQVQNIEDYVSGTEQQTDMRELSSGVYLLSVKSGTGDKTLYASKIVKQ